MTPIDIVRSAYDQFAEGDLQAALKVCSPDVAVIQDPRLPWGGHYLGHDGVGEFALKLAATIDSAVMIEQIFQGGEQVVQHGRTKGAVRHNGARFDIPECHIWTIREGLITEARFYIDSAAMLVALER